MKIAVLDDYQNIALELADWSTLARRAEITVFNDHIADPVFGVIADRIIEPECSFNENHSTQRCSSCRRGPQ